MWVPTWAPLGVQVKAPPAVIEAPAGTVPEVPLASVKVSVSPASGSVAVAVKASSLPAVAVLSPTGSRTGAALAADTTTSIVSQSERSPSETHTSKVWVPTWAPLGVQVKAPPAVIEAPAGTVPEVPLASVKVRVSPASGSVAVAVKASSRAGGGGLVAHRVEDGSGIGRGHDHVDRLAVGEIAVGDAHVEGVGSDLGAARRPGEGAARGDRGARGHRARGAVGQREGQVSPASGSVAVAVKASSVPAVAVLSPTGSRTGAALAADTTTSIVSQSRGLAVGDAHVEGVGPTWAPLGVQVKAPPAVIEAPAGTVPEVRGEREGQGVARVGIGSGRREGELGAGGGGLVAHRVRTGAALAADTTTSIVSQSERAPSETHTSKVWVPTWAPLGVQVKAPPAVIEAPRAPCPRCRWPA